MIVSHIPTEEKATCRPEENTDSRVSREFLVFWSMHPNAKFNKAAIRYALDFTKLEIEMALATLVETGLVDQHVSNGVTLYSLTTNEEKRKPIIAYTTHSHHWC